MWEVQRNPQTAQKETSNNQVAVWKLQLEINKECNIFNINYNDIFQIENGTHRDNNRSLKNL